MDAGYVHAGMTTGCHPRVLVSGIQVFLLYEYGCN
jgi:hypothetical protein